MTYWQAMQGAYTSGGVRRSSWVEGIFVYQGVVDMEDQGDPKNDQSPYSYEYRGDILNSNGVLSKYISSSEDQSATDWVYI